MGMKMQTPLFLQFLNLGGYTPHTLGQPSSEEDSSAAKPGEPKPAVPMVSIS